MSKTIKIIELLNKIANGEEVPKKVKYEREIYNFKEIDYKNENRNLYLFTEELQDITSVLNDIVEIIEEQKEIDKLEIDDNGFIHTNNGTWKGRKLDVAFAESINKLAEAIKNIKEK